MITEMTCSNHSGSNAMSSLRVKPLLTVIVQSIVFKAKYKGEKKFVSISEFTQAFYGAGLIRIYCF